MKPIEPGQVAGRLTVGDFHISALLAGRMRYDGGSVFGVAPQVHWAEWLPPDEVNRVDVAMWSLVVDTPKGLAVVETGFGSKARGRLREVFDLEEGAGLRSAVSVSGHSPDDVALVVVSHMHQDHAGGTTTGEPGSWGPTFPNAEVICQAGEWYDGWHADAQTVNGYRKQEVMVPLQEAGVLRLVEGDVEVAPGVSVVVTKGHTRCHQAVMVESRGEALCFPGDLIPTHRHLRPIYVTAWDLYGRDTFLNKRRLLGRAADEGWWMVFPHDADVAWGKVLRDPRREFVLDEATALRAR